MAVSYSVCCGVFHYTLCVLTCVTWVFACRWGLRVLSDGRRRGQQSHNFRQLETGELLTVSHLSHSVLFTSCGLDWLPVFLCFGDYSKLPLTSSGFGILCLHLRKGKSNLFNFCDGQIIGVYSSVKSVFILFAFMRGSVCYTVQGILQERLCSLYLSFLKFSHSEKWKSLSC